MKDDKRACQQEHAKRRCRERLGFTLTPEDEQQIIHKIQNGIATFIERQSNRISLFGVMLRGTETVVVYDRVRKVVVTLIPRDFYELNRSLNL